MRALGVVVALVACTAAARPVQKPVAYEVDGKAFEGVLVYDDAVKTPRPGLVLVPNWMGINAANLKQAAQVAGTRYVVFVADMYGRSVRPKSEQEAGPISGAVKADRKQMRARVARALEVLRTEGRALRLDAKRVGAIGFCFGGTSVLELARSGADVAGVVSFHGGLDAPLPAQGLRARVLVLHGADDPFVPPAEVQGFEEEMRKAKADWQLVKYGGAVHSFTDPDAHAPGKAQYEPRAARRAFAAMEAFFAEAFARE